MFSVSILSLIFTAAQPASAWHSDYAKATAAASKEKKDLLIYFRGEGELDDALADADVQKKLDSFVCLRVPVDYKYEGKRLLDYPVLGDMLGKPGLVVVSYHNKKLLNFACPISMHPVVSSRYRWVPAYGAVQVKIILDLPAHASLSQRSMIYAVRVHPEVPQSVFCTCHPAFLDHAQSHSQRQASMGRQHHANLGAVMGSLQGRVEVGFSGASEVVAESWGRFVGGENVLEAAYSCIDAWRQSPGHWRSVSGRHTFFGYDIAQGGNGTWYATGIFGH